MTAPAVIKRGQSAAEALMVDACEIRRQTGTVFDENTGRDVPTFGDPLYAGKCRVQLRDTLAETPNAGERVVTVQRILVFLPVSVTGVQVDDVITVTASIDPELVDRQLRVRTLMHKTFLTARRLECTEVQS